MLLDRLLDGFDSQHFLDAMARYHLGAGGKFLRGRLAIAEGNVVGLKAADSLQWALCCELIHNATLIHDDIQDRDPMRRGQESLWKKFGSEQALNAGDLFIFKAFQKAAGLKNSKLIEILAESSETLVKGQSNEFLIPERNPQEGYWSLYLNTAIGKTSSLFQLPIYGVHILKNQSIDPLILESWKEFGICYQIIDDISDFYGLKQKGQKQKDFHEKKINALMAQLSLNAKNQNLINRYLDGSDSLREQLLLISEIEERLNQENVFEKLEDWIQEKLKNVLAHTQGETRNLITELISASPLQGVKQYENQARLI